MKGLLLAATIAFTTLPVTLNARAQGRQRVALLPISGSNIHPGYLDAARDILKDHLIATGRFEVFTAPGESGAGEVAGEQAVAAGRALGAELAVVTHLARLSGTGRLRLMAYRTADGVLVHADSLGIAGGPDDLDPALKRLADGLATGKRASDTANIDTMTQREADPLLKQTATKIFGLRLGGLAAFNAPGDEETSVVPGLGVFWMYDARSFLGEVGLDFHSSDEANDFSVSIGGYYPFSKGNATPYAGTRVSYSVVDFGGAGAHGLRLAPAIGFLWGRVSTVQLRGELGYFLNTFGERPSYDGTIGVPTGTSGPKRYAHGPLLSVGLGF